MGEESTMRVESTRKRHVERFFWEVVDIDRSHAWECKTIPRTHGFHSVRSSDNPLFCLVSEREFFAHGGQIRILLDREGVASVPT